MKKLLLLLVPVLLLSFSKVCGQQYTQTVRGNVKDADGKFALPGASVSLVANLKVINVMTDDAGKFRFDNIPVGRFNLQVSYIGYEDKFLNNMEVSSGKEVVLELELRESVTQMNDIIVKARKNKGEVSNDMSLISARQVTVDETQRYAGSFNDPARMVSSFAGVTANPEGNNDIVVRGNSPKYIQWRLEGLEIPNPNHFGNVGSTGGPISALNSNMLANSDFYTGAFSPEYGDVLSGVFDVKFRNGNNEKREYTFGFGALGIEATLEGPFKKGYNGSYLINYRYSSLALIDNLGLVDFGGVPKYQDAAFKINLPSRKLGALTLFGMAGKSRITEITNYTEQEYISDSERFDYEADNTFWLNNHLYTLGLNHTLPLSKRTFIQTTIGFSGNGINEREEVSYKGQILDERAVTLRDSSTAAFMDYDSKLFDQTLNAGIRLSSKWNSKLKLEAGTKYILKMNDYQTSYAQTGSTALYKAIDLNKNLGAYRSFIASQYRLNQRTTFVAGVHHFYVPFTGESSLEPRASARLSISNNSVISLGYGKHSRMEHISTYFARVKDENGQISEPNRKLGLLKADHFVVGYEKRFTTNFMGKMELYYQKLNNLPVDANGSYYSTINETEGFYDIALVNKGTGKNYGLELTLERFFANNYYYLLSGSVYQSKYKALDGVERNSAYNGNYSFNFLLGKEFVHLGRKKNKTLGLNAKLFYVGARKIIPLLRDEQGRLNVDELNGKYYDTSKAYEYDLDDVFQLNASASLKINKSRTAHEFMVDIINANNTQARLYEYYDSSASGKIGYGEPLSILPNIIYRVHF